MNLAHTFNEICRVVGFAVIFFGGWYVLGHLWHRSKLKAKLDERAEDRYFHKTFDGIAGTPEKEEFHCIAWPKATDRMREHSNTEKQAIQARCDAIAKLDPLYKLHPYAIIDDPAFELNRPGGGVFEVMVAKYGADEYGEPKEPIVDPNDHDYRYRHWARFWDDRRKEDIANTPPDGVVYKELLAKYGPDEYGEPNEPRPVGFRVNSHWTWHHPKRLAAEKAAREGARRGSAKLHINELPDSAEDFRDDENNKTEKTAIAEVARRFLRADDEMKRLFINDFSGQQFICQFGLKIDLVVEDGHHLIRISLNHISKKEIVNLVNAGKLVDELLFLYTLGHLPFAKEYLLNLGDQEDTDIVDSVTIDLDKSFNVFDEKQWAEHGDAVVKRAYSLYSVYESEAFYARLRESRKKV